MPPPPSYLDITSVPYSQLVTQADFNAGTFGGTPKHTWFRYVTAIPACLGVHSNRGGTFNPSITIYQSDGTTVVKAGNASTSFYGVLASAGTYYVDVTQAVVSDSDFTFIADAKPLNNFTIPPGSLVINDDANGPPACVMTPTGTILGFLSDIPGGEIATALLSGESMWQDRYGKWAAAGSFTIFDANLARLISVNPESWGSFHTPVASSNTDFYILYKTNGRIYKVTPTGTITGPIATVSTGTPNLIFAFGVSRDGSIAYWAQKGDLTIHRHDLNTNLPLSDLYTATDAFGITSNNLPGEILCLPDNTIVTWFGPLFGDGTLIHLSPSGVLLSSNVFPTYKSINHITLFNDQSLFINIWRFIQPNLDDAKYSTVDISSLAEVPTFNISDFQNQVNLKSDDPIVLGPSESCSYITYKFAVIPPPVVINPSSGIYKLVKDKRQDTLWNDTLTGTVNVKIP